MKMDNASIFEELWATRNVSTPEEEIRFVNAAKTLEFGDNSLLPDILYLFQDDVPNLDPFKYLANLVASLDDVLVIKYLVERAPDINHVARGWLNLLFSILLKEELVSVWIENLRMSSPSVHSVVFDLFDELENESLSFKSISGDEETFHANMLRTIKVIREVFHVE
jgi:hypothetical protein